MRKDPTVRAHYAGFNVKQSRLVRLTEDHYSYVSYRLKNQIFWTRKRLKLPKGEALLTDGKKYVRCRCGNQISDSPQPVTSEVEPLETLLSRPSITLDNLEDFDFSEAPQVADIRPLPLELDLVRQFDAESLQDPGSDARIKLKNPTPQHSSRAWLAALPLGALPFLALNHKHSTPAGNSLVTPNNSNGGTNGNTGGTNPPVRPPGGGGGGNPPKPPPIIPPLSPVPEPAELGVELIAIAGLVGAKIAFIRRRRAAGAVR
ncbi:MAG: hypothetical protein JOZ29_05150, partial [Deltaproteobacteria bacterium]|nr:hypothetical protein [Deltaproteobacteria bacterium]